MHKKGTGKTKWYADYTNVYMAIEKWSEKNVFPVNKFGKFWNWQNCEKRISITYSQRG